jgi:hypothetical protein
MSQQPELTSKQQALMNFLDELATAPLTTEMLAQGNALLDDAADECCQQQDSLPLPVEAPISQRIVSSIVRFPILGNLIVFLDSLTGGIVALFGAISIWFVVQGLEIAGRFHLYFEGSAENLLYKQNRRRYEAPSNSNPATKRAYRLVKSETLSILRWLSIAGLVAYVADIYAMHLTRPWLDNLGNPLWINIIWNGLAVVGVELALILYRGYKVVTLSNAEKADKDRTFN